MHTTENLLGTNIGWGIWEASLNKTTLLTLWRLLSARERQTVNSKIVSELITYNARRNAYYQNKEERTGISTAA